MARKSGAVFKRCQECGAVRRPGEFKRAGGSNVVGNERPVRCPTCGHVAPAWAFVPVEKPAEDEGLA